MRTAARFITIPRSGPRHRARDFFLNVPHLQKLSEYGDAESIMRAELQAQRTELLEIIRQRSPKIEIYTESSPNVEKQSDQPVLHEEDSDVEMGEAEPLVESPIPVVRLNILHTPVKNVDEFDVNDVSSDGLSPMDVDEEYRER